MYHVGYRRINGCRTQSGRGYVTKQILQILLVLQGEGSRAPALTLQCRKSTLTPAPDRHKACVT